MSQVQVWRCRVESGFDAQRAAERKPITQILFPNQFSKTFLQIRKLLFNWEQVFILKDGY
jgi:hypothetical protein